MKIFGYEFGKKSKPPPEVIAPTMELPALPTGTLEDFGLPTVDTPPTQYTIQLSDLDPFQPKASVGMGSSQGWGFTGEKFPGGLDASSNFTTFDSIATINLTNYWVLRNWSNKLFTENLYARGLIRRLITNEINTGLTLEATPIGSILGIDDETLNVWTENVENRFTIWGKNPDVCDFRRLATFGSTQRAIRIAALVSGDVLVVLRHSRVTNLPGIQLVPGESIITPVDDKPRAGHEIVHGVELDGKKRQVAAWVRQSDGTTKRVPFVGERTGRRLAWLVYGTEKRHEEVRGQPILSLVLQSLKEIDRMRDAEQRAAVINSMLAMVVEKDVDKLGTLPLTGAAVRRDSIPIADGSGGTRDLTLNGQLPGFVLDELQQGEKIKSFDTSRPNVNFGVFEAAIVNAVAWANEIPPEILTLAFQNNYSASRAAMNELKMYLNKMRSEFGDTVCQPIYVSWLLSEVRNNKISAAGLFEASRDPRKYDTFGAWVLSEWDGAIKPSVDLLKEVKGYQAMVTEGWITNDRAAKELSGTKFSRNIKRVEQENGMKAEAKRPLLELQEEFVGDEVGETEARLNALIMEQLEAFKDEELPETE